MCVVVIAKIRLSSKMKSEKSDFKDVLVVSGRNTGVYVDDFENEESLRK